jgi:hypothetical protein
MSPIVNTTRASAFAVFATAGRSGSPIHTASIKAGTRTILTRLLPIIICFIFYQNLAQKQYGNCVINCGQCDILIGFGLFFSLCNAIMIDTDKMCVKQTDLTE